MSSQSPLSTQPNSPSLLVCPPSHSSSPKPASSPSPSLYVTLKVLQLVNTFRKRVRTRVRNNRILKKETSTRITEDYCQGFERQAFDEIDRYLGRKIAVHTRKRTYPKYERALERENDLKSIGAKRTTAVATPNKAKQDSLPPRNIQWLVDELDQSVKSESHSLVAVAKNHELFVGRKSELHIERLSLKELTQLLVVVKDLLATLRRPTSTRLSARTLAEGNELLDLALDENTTANFEHLLLCLKDQLLRLLVSKVVDLVRKQLAECQRDQTRHFEECVFEFPGAKRPLSTTWPWSIRPSLAVLWGVCWMFFDHLEDYSFFDFDDPTLYALTSTVSRPMLQHAQPAPQQHQFFYQANLDPANFRPASQHGAAADPRSPRSFPHAHSLAANQTMPSPQPLPQRRGLTVATPHPFYAGPRDQAVAASAGLAIPGTNIPPGQHGQYATAPPNSYARPSAVPATSANHWPLPQEFHRAQHQHFAFAQDSAHGADEVGAWNLPLDAQQQNYSLAADWFQQPAGLPPRSSQAPEIRVITAGLQAQPQDPYHSATSHSSAPNSSSTIPPQDYQFGSYNEQHLSPQAARGGFMTSDEKMQHTPPVSPNPNSPSRMAAMGEQLSRKRSHEEMTGALEDGQAPQEYGGHSRGGSVSSQHFDQSAGERVSQRTRTIKRSDAPVNGQGKFICTFSNECTDLIFDRKCEWSKHMDKHIRPYRCGHAECAKLQGFTYSGGLLRHEREVHNKHGGPKATLVCPYADCKRHNGKGFTRKENLNEHVRRVHESTKEGGTQSQSLKNRADASNHVAEDGETPYFTQDHDETAESPLRKRRRFTQGMSERSASEDVEDLRQELHRLHQETQEKDSRMREMQEQIQQLQHSILLLQQTTTTQQSQQTQGPPV